MEEIYSIIRDGSLADVRRFIEQQRIAESVNNLTDQDGLTPYLVAAEAGHTEIFDYLASLPNFDVTKKDKHNLNALLLATIRGRMEMFDHPVKKHKFDTSQSLHYAIRNSGDLKTVEHLLTNHAFPVTDDLIKFARDCNKPAVATYLDKIAKLNEALQVAIKNKDFPTFKNLCEKQGAKPKSTARSLAEDAALNGALNIFEYLAQRRDYNYLDRTFLAQEALFKKNWRLLESLLFKENLDPNLGFSYEGKSYNSLYEFAETRFDNEASNNEAYAYLKNLKKENEEFTQAVKNNDQDLILGDRILQSTINRAALQCAASGNLEIYQKISRSKKFDKNFCDEKGRNIFHLAVTSGNVEFVDYLLESYQFSLDNISKPEIFTAAQNFPKLETYLVKKDAWFLLKKNPDLGKEISAVFYDETKSEEEIIAAFEDLKTITENPYRLARHLFKNEPGNYFDTISYLTDRGFTKLYAKLAANEPELRIGYKYNLFHFYHAAESAKNGHERFSENYAVFEEAMGSFGDSSHIFLLERGRRDTALEAYLEGLLTSGRVVTKRLSSEEIVSCLIPSKNNLKHWRSSDPSVFYSFQTPVGWTDIPFDEEEKKFFNSVVAKAAKNIIVPVEEIRLTAEELQAVVENRFDKNVFFIVKGQIEGNAVYPITTSHQNRNEVAHKIIIVPVEKILGREYAMLHQLAIGIADLKHPSYYDSSIDTEPNCDNSVTIADSIMSHICPPGSYSAGCFNRGGRGDDEFPDYLGFREADVRAISRSLVRQYPELENQTCAPEENQIATMQMILVAFLLGAVATYFLARPRARMEPTNTDEVVARVAARDDPQQHG
ncbi:MAG: ankyrin repeat domain-containing protein [Alphaproteobacteria bacterium]|nr:ankyrin repeat domain-containing protein [Alphaproteobacteria bacterium]